MFTLQPAPPRKKKTPSQLVLHDNIICTMQEIYLETEDLKSKSLLWRTYTCRTHCTLIREELEWGAK